MEGLLYRLKGNDQPVRKIIAEYEKNYDLDVGIGLILFKHLIVNRHVTVDMNVPIDINNSGESFCISIGSE